MKTGTAKLTTTQTVTIRLLKDYMQPHRRESFFAERQPWKSAAEYCPGRFVGDPAYLGIIHNGEAITWDEAQQRIPAGDDELVFYHAPADAGLATTLIVSIVLAGVSAGISAAIAHANRPPRRERISDSPTYGFDGIKNTVNPGTTIPIIYGLHRFAGHILRSVLKVPENAASLVNFNTSNGALHTLLGIASGEIDSISSIRSDKNPIENFKAVETETRMGTLHQSAITGFEDQENQFIKQDSLTNAGGEVIYTTSGNVDQIEVVFEAPQGMGAFTAHGALVGSWVDINVRWRISPAGTWSSPIGAGFTGNTQHPFKRYARTPRLERGKYDIGITRIKADSTAPEVFDVVEIFAITEITAEEFTYPGMALVGIRQMPTSQISGRVPEYDCLVKGKKVRVYSNPTTYVTQWSDNPAWCVYDYLTDELNGLGAFIDKTAIDSDVIQSFIDWADFCNTNGYTLNIVLDGSMSAMESLKQMAAVGRGMMLFRGDKFRAIPDEDGPAVQTFTMGRIKKDSFAVQIAARSDKPNFHIGEFANKDLDYELDPLPKEDQTQPADNGTVVSNVSLVGVTDIEHANKLLTYYNNSSRLSRRVIEFDAFAEALAMEAGDIFQVAHDVPQWGASGRIRKVIGASGTELILDREVTIEAGKSYQITVIHRADDTTETHTVTTPATSATDKIAIGGSWSTVPVDGEDYSFGEVDKLYEKYRCLMISRADRPWRRRITARQHDPSVYSLDSEVMPTASVSSLPDPRVIPPNVTELRVLERHGYNQDGTILSAIDVYFTPAAFAKGTYRIYWREKDATNERQWAVAGETESGYFSIVGNVETPDFTYEVSVVSVSRFNVSKHPDDGSIAEITTVQSDRQPSDVTDFAVDRTHDGLSFSWTALDPEVDFDLSFYEIRYGSSWGSAILVGRTTETEYRTTGTVQSPSGGNTYLIKARNNAGNYSVNDDSVTFTVDPRINDNVILTQTEDPGWTGTKVGCTVDTGDLVFSGTSGSYTTAKFQVTSSNAVRSLVSTVVESVVGDLGLTWDDPTVGAETWDGDFAAQNTWNPTTDEGVSVVVEMRFSELTSADGDFGAWQPRVQNFEVKVKWAQARIVVTIDNSSLEVTFDKFRIHFDVPDLLDEGEETTSASGTTQVNFNRDYQNAPAVVGSTIGGSDGDEIQISGITKDKFDVGVRNSAAWVVRTIDWHARGF